MKYNQEYGMVKEDNKLLMIALALGFALLMTLGMFSLVQASSPFYQGFETDASGWLDADDAWYGDVTRVPSGDTGIVSSEGNYHAVMSGDGISGPFSRFDAYRDTWPGDYKTEVNVYLDPAWDAGTGFDYTVASNGSDNTHQRDFIFHVTKDTSSGELLVAGSNNTNFAPREDLDTLANHYAVPTAGWYTLQHSFRDDGGILAVDLNLLDSDGNVLFTETRSAAADVMAEIGGNRYAWFTFINVTDGIAVDAHELIITLPTPETKQDCKKDGWMNLEDNEGNTFKNQGDCVSFVATSGRNLGNGR